MSDLFVTELDPLPDFLNDHTLAGQSDSERLRECLGRWVQMVQTLHVWSDQALFAIRYVADAGTIRVFFVARPLNSIPPDAMSVSLVSILRSHRLLRHEQEVTADAAVFHEASRLERPVFQNLSQYATTTFLKLQRGARLAMPGSQPRGGTQIEALPVIYPWRGPGGPFLLPMEVMASLPAKCSLTISLLPTTLSEEEQEWLGAVAGLTQSLGDQNQVAVGQHAALRRRDPSAAIAGRLFEVHLKRLTAAPYIAFVQCAVADQRHDLLRTLSGAVQAAVHESPQVGYDEELARLPSGTTTFGCRSREEQSHSGMFYDSLDASPLLRGGIADQLPLLVDALGATTLFRLPISVRSGVPGVRVKQLPPDFHPGPRNEKPEPGVPTIELGRFEGGGRAFIALNDLARHVLVTGFTGSGKTFTVLQILRQLWQDHRIPFLVLESAKSEYRGMLGMEGFQQGDNPLRIYTMGNERCAPLRFNPFELLPGVRVESHIARLQICFEAAAPMVGPSASVIAEALHTVYELRGWELSDRCPREGPVQREFPRIGDFIAELEQVIVRRGYRGEVLANLQAALIGRFRPLQLGSKGKMFDVRTSQPSARQLFSTPTVIEMNDLNREEKALAVMFLVTMLREFRETTKSDIGGLRHVTVVEEAHNILEEAPIDGGAEGTKSNTRRTAVEAFCGLLTEIRSLGEGLVICDQSPRKLARDAIRNTNLQIVHQLRDATDRQTVAESMIMDDCQRDFVAKLEPGSAAVFRTGMERAAFVRIPPIQCATTCGPGFQPNLADDDVARLMRQIDADPMDAPFSDGQDEERLRDAIFPLVAQPQARQRASQWREALDQTEPKAGGTDVLGLAFQCAVDDLCRSNITVDEESIWCHFALSWRLATSKQLDDPSRNKLSADHRRAVTTHLRRWLKGRTTHTGQPA